MKEIPLPKVGEIYTVMVKGKAVAKGVYIGANEGKHRILTRSKEGTPQTYSFIVPYDPSLIGTIYTDYNIEDHNITLPSTTRGLCVYGKEKDLAHKILEMHGL